MIIIDNAPSFISGELSIFFFGYGIIRSHSSNYYPQDNGLPESSNTNLMSIIKRTTGDNKNCWDNKLRYVVWEDKITIKESTRKSPFELVYGLDATLPINLRLPIYIVL